MTDRRKCLEKVTKRLRNLFIDGPCPTYFKKQSASRVYGSLKELCIAKREVQALSMALGCKTTLAAPVASQRVSWGERKRQDSLCLL